MRTNQYIDDYIKREKETELNPFLITKVMAKIENSKETATARQPLWRVVPIAISFAIAAFVGVLIGNGYIEKESPEYVMNINDSQIENLSFYIFDDYEQNK